MQTTQPILDTFSAIGREIGELSWHLAGTGAALGVFVMVYAAGWVIGHGAGETSTAAAFENCGKAYCVGEAIPVFGPSS